MNKNPEGRFKSRKALFGPNATLTRNRMEKESAVARPDIVPFGKRGNSKEENIRR